MPKVSFPWQKTVFLEKNGIRINSAKKMVIFARCKALFEFVRISLLGIRPSSTDRIRHTALCPRLIDQGRVRTESGPLCQLPFYHPNPQSGKVLRLLFGKPPGTATSAHHSHHTGAVR